MRYRHGFTILELSIVLVVIALILGGTLLGRDLIASAEVRAQISQYDELSTAVSLFEAKHGCLPGDCRDMTTLFSYANVANGNGNGMLNDGNGGDLHGQFSGEILQFFPALSAGGFIKGPYVAAASSSGVGPDNNFPYNAFNRGGIVAVSFRPGDHFWVGGLMVGSDIAADIAGEHFFVTDNSIGDLTPFESFQIDSKMDDGQGRTGDVYVGFGTQLDEVQGVSGSYSATSCLASATSYNLVTNPDRRSCVLNVRWR